MKRFLIGGILAVLFVPGAAFAAGRAPQTYRSEHGRPLTTPSHQSATQVALGFLKARGLAAAHAATVRTASEERAITGLTLVRLEQDVNGLPVHGAYAKAAVDDQGQLVHLVDNLVAVPASGVTAARVGTDQATHAAVAYLFPKGTMFFRPPSAQRVAIPNDAGGLEEGFVVETWTARDNQLNETLVGGDGRVISTELRTNTDKYNVFTENPTVTPQRAVDGPGAGNAESPSGWLAGNQTTQVISGNNVHAYLDINADNQPDGGGAAVKRDMFMTAADLTVTPKTTGNRNVAVQNVFYLANVIHDTLYRAGFTEATGNFQVNNFGEGGRGNDPVLAEAQDGSGTDNANFATPRDGTSPRMQMFLWTGKGINQVVVDAPAGVVGTYRAQGATFGAAPTVTGVTAAITVANDGAGVTTDACETLAAGSLSGQIALMDRGTCAFVVKVKNVQNAGAVAAIVANNVNGDSILTMGGTDATITIPAVFISQNDGTRLKAAAPGLHGTVRLTDPPPLQRDGDVDSDVVFHESGHGLTWRMIGKMSGPMSGAIGEGMSDVLAVILDNDDRVGEYSFDDPLGLRSAPYTNYPRSYGDVTGSEVHFDGEVYGAIGWLMWQIYQREGISRDELLADLVDGMNFTPAGPRFEDMRDGILQSIANSGSGRECLIWEAFAQYGVGVGARGQVKGAAVVVSESFALPPECQ